MKPHIWVSHRMGNTATYKCAGGSAFDSYCIGYGQTPSEAYFEWSKVLRRRIEEGFLADARRSRQQAFHQIQATRQ